MAYVNFHIFANNLQKFANSWEHAFFEANAFVCFYPTLEKDEAFFEVPAARKPAASQPRGARRGWGAADAQAWWDRSGEWWWVLYSSGPPAVFEVSSQCIETGRYKIYVLPVFSMNNSLYFNWWSIERDWDGRKDTKDAWFQLQKVVRLHAVSFALMECDIRPSTYNVYMISVSEGYFPNCKKWVRLTGFSSRLSGRLCRLQC